MVEIERQKLLGEYAAEMAKIKGSDEAQRLADITRMKEKEFEAKIAMEETTAKAKVQMEEKFARAAAESQIRIRKGWQRHKPTMTP